MKKVPFIICFIIEVLLALIFTGLLLSSLGAFSYLVGAVVLCAALTPFFVRLKNTEDEQGKKRIRTIIFLITLAPIAVGIVVVAAVVVAMILWFG